MCLVIFSPTLSPFHFPRLPCLYNENMNVFYNADVNAVGMASWAGIAKAKTDCRFTAYQKDGYIMRKSDTIKLPTLNESLVLTNSRHSTVHFFNKASS